MRWDGMEWNGMRWDGMGWDENYPYYPNNRLFFRETPPPPLKLNLNGNYPNYRLFLERPHPHP